MLDSVRLCSWVPVGIQASEQWVNIYRPLVHLPCPRGLFVIATAELGNSYITASWDLHLLAGIFRPIANPA